MKKQSKKNAQKTTTPTTEELQKNNEKLIAALMLATQEVYRYEVLEGKLTVLSANGIHKIIKSSMEPELFGPRKDGIPKDTKEKWVERRIKTYLDPEPIDTIINL